MSTVTTKRPRVQWSVSIVLPGRRDTLVSPGEAGVPRLPINSNLTDHQPAHHIRLCLPPFDGNPGVVRIAVGKEQADYFLTELPADFGRGFLVEKVGSDTTEGTYHVNLDGAKRSCECKGFGRWQRCKHADGLAALIAAGRL